MYNVPEGSKIVVTADDRGFPKVILPQAARGLQRILPTVMLAAWLGGWAIGWLVTVKILIFQDVPDGTANIFMLLWLIGWTAGGIAVICFFGRILRPVLPEILVFNSSTLEYDTGRDPFRYAPWRLQNGTALKTFLSKREMFSLPLPRIRTFMMRNGFLTVDIGVDRREVGYGLTEIEKEWLLATIKQKYGF